MNSLRRILLPTQNSLIRVNLQRSISDQFNDTRQAQSLEKSLNQVTLLGRTGSNPEERGTEEHPVVTFSLATNVNYNKGTEVMQQTEWHRVSVFRPFLREKLVKFLQKGQRVLVTGRITYMERKDVTNPSIVHKNAIIVAEDIIFLSK